MSRKVVLPDRLPLHGFQWYKEIVTTRKVVFPERVVFPEEVVPVRFHCTGIFSWQFYGKTYPFFFKLGDI